MRACGLAPAPRLRYKAAFRVFAPGAARPGPTACLAAGVSSPQGLNPIQEVRNAKDEE
jgi:hypothetical protein